MGLLGQPVCERRPKEPGLFSLRKQKNLAIPTQLRFPPASVGIKAAGFLTLLGVLSLNTMGAESDLEEEKSRIGPRGARAGKDPARSGLN